MKTPYGINNTNKSAGEILVDGLIFALTNELEKACNKVGIDKKEALNDFVWHLNQALYSQGLSDYITLRRDRVPEWLAAIAALPENQRSGEAMIKAISIHLKSTTKKRSAYDKFNKFIKF